MGTRWAEPPTEVDRVAALLIETWETAEGAKVNPSYVATFVDMARAVIADRRSVDLCDSRGPRIGDDGCPRCRRPKGHPGWHACDPEDGYGDVRWGD